MRGSKPNREYDPVFFVAIGGLAVISLLALFYSIERGLANGNFSSAFSYSSLCLLALAVLGFTWRLYLDYTGKKPIDGVFKTILEAGAKVIDLIAVPTLPISLALTIYSFAQGEFLSIWLPMLIGSSTIVFTNSKRSRTPKT